MHVEQSNNITVAYATPLNMMPDKTSNIQPHRAIVTRGDLLGTSKYYKYHKSMGHTPQYIQHIAGSQKKTFCRKWASNSHAQTSLSHPWHINQENKKQTAFSSISSQQDWCPVRGELLWSDQLRALLVKASSPGATTWTLHTWIRMITSCNIHF